MSPRHREDEPDLMGFVRCGGDRHRLLLTDRGLVLVDHEAISSERSAIALIRGMKPCRCMQILEEVNAGNLSSVPYAIRERLEHKRRLRQRTLSDPATGRDHRSGSPQAALIADVTGKLHASIAPLLTQLDCTPTFAMSINIALTPGTDSPAAPHFGLAVAGSLSPTKADVSICLRPDWGRRVTVDRAIVDGRFVVDLFYSSRGNAPHARFVDWRESKHNLTEWTAHLATARLVRGGDRYHLDHDLPLAARRARVSTTPAGLEERTPPEGRPKIARITTARTIIAAAKSTPLFVPGLDELVQWAGNRSAISVAEDFASGQVRVVHLAGPSGVGKTRILRAAAARYKELNPSADCWIGDQERLFSRAAPAPRPRSGLGALFLDDVPDVDPDEHARVRRELSERREGGWHILAASRASRAAMMADPPAGQRGEVVAVHPPTVAATVEVLSRDMPFCSRSAIWAIAERFPTNLFHARVALAFCDHASICLWERLESNFVHRIVELIDLDPRPILVGRDLVPIDRSGTFTLPTAYVGALGTRTYLTAGIGPCLCLAPDGRVPSARQHQGALSLTSRVFVGNGNRITLNQNQRAFGGIRREVVVVGAGEHLEFWSPHHWERRRG